MFAAALSEHPDAAHAVGDVAGQVLEALSGPESAGRPGPPDLAVIFVTAPHAEELAEAAKLVRAVLKPRALIGCAAESVLGGRREVEHAPAVALWAGRTGPVVPFHLSTTPTPDGDTITGWPDIDADDANALLLLADPFSFPVEDFLRRFDDDRPGLAVVGGLASAGRAPGGNRLVIDDQVFTDGAVAVFLGPAVAVSTVVSQGCRPLGNPFIVTRSEANIVGELAGLPALQRLQEVAAAATEEDRALLSQGVHLGQVIDESRVDFGRGDFLVRNVIGADYDNGALAVGDVVEVGSTVQFQVRDAGSADEDLRNLLAEGHADSALLFTCNGRGTRLFGTADHDAKVVAESVGSTAVAGMFCAGEVGPIGGHNFLHGFTASVALISGTGAPEELPKEMASEEKR